MMRKIIRNVLKTIRLFVFRLRNLQKERFECPICGYCGPFADISTTIGLRKHAQCPGCSALERHRMQFVVLQNIAEHLNTAKLSMLHFAPEPFFRHLFSQIFGQYETADFSMKDVDHRVDLRQLPFTDATYDFVFASHVLEHIADDDKAISEIRRVLKPNGIAILPVPVIGEKTVEYPEPNPFECGHVRAPGMDYFDRYERYFTKVDKICSDSLPGKYQVFVYENRSQWPTPECPLRPAMNGERHRDVVPVCYA